VGGTLVRDGSAARSALEPPTPAQYRALLSRFHADARLRELYERYGRFPAVEWWKGRAGARGDPCTFLEHPYVSAEGTMYPCRLCHANAFAVGEAFEKPLDVTLGEAIAKARELVRLARGRLVASRECQRCPARLPCAGGCVGRALAAGGSVAAAEDRCELRKRVQLWEPPASATTWRGTTSVSAAPDRAPRDAVIGMPTAAAVSRVEAATDPRVAHLAAPEQILSMDIHELLAEEREAIVDEAWRSVVKLTHYERDGKEATRQRTEVLFDHVAHAIRVRDLGDLLDYAERIAKQRFDAGFEMCEVQNAFYMVEDAIARRALARLPPAALAEALGLVGTAIRRGKDQFARAYISLANRKRAPSLDLSDLFKGR
jgi:radical SAM protein with 4Fe4S-binding SPASM domain